MLKLNLKTREIFCYSEIGPSWAGMTSATDFVDALDELGEGDVTIRLNSPGGTADEAFAAVQLLKRHDGQVNVSVDSIAASAASFFLNEDFHVTAAPTSRIMIHYSSTITYGTAKEHLKTVDILNAYDESIITSYARIKKSVAEIADMLEAETWLSAREALELGLIDAIVDGIALDPTAPKVRIREGVYRHTPEDLIERPNKPAWQRQSGGTPNLTKAKLRLEQLKAGMR